MRAIRHGTFIDESDCQTMNLMAPSPSTVPADGLMLSIVVPCFNEAACLDRLAERLHGAAISAVGASYEIILVNDGSRDDSWQRMVALGAANPALSAINLSRNHGHQLALTAGLDLSRGAHIFIIDADLQDPPELLSAMLELLRREGADVVYGVRASRSGETAFKRWSAKLFYRLLSRATEVEIPIDTGDFRLMTRRALDVFLAMPEQSRFVRGMVAWAGFRQVPLAYDRAKRFAGTTSYPLAKMVRFALDAVTGFSSAPLKLASYAGLLLSAASFLLLVYIGVGWWVGSTIEGWTSLMLVVVMLGAVQMFVLGLISEYLGRVYTEVKGRPLYIVAEMTGRARSGSLGHLSARTIENSDTPVGIETRPTR